jgi:hypothetical protein
MKVDQLTEGNMYKIGYFATDRRRFFEEGDGALVKTAVIRLMEG